MNQKVSIIILNWNGYVDTIECLESVYQIKYPVYNVILVDNGSEDESIEMIRKYAKGKIDVRSDFFIFNKNNKPIQIFEYSNIDLKSLSEVDKRFNELDSDKRLILIKNDHNAGFSEGNNIGINFSLEFLNSEYILLLNNDTVVEKNFLNEMINLADNNYKIGIVGPKVLYYDNPDKTAYIGHNVNLCNGRLSDPNIKLDSSSSAIKIDFVVGCGLLIKNKVIKDIGVLDPDYFLYYEDVDWCLRAQKKGYEIFYVPKSIIWHKIPLGKDRSLKSYYYGNRNSFLLIKKNNESNGILFCYVQLILNKFILSIYLLLKGNRKASFAVIKALYDALFVNYGYKKLD